MLEDMKQHAGFTIVEIVIALTIMAILVSLAAVNMRSSLLQANDQERITDISNIMLYQDSYYDKNNSSYFPTTSASSAQIDTWYADIDRGNLRSPGTAAPGYSLVPAINANQTTAGVRPIPTRTTYVYQPLDSSNALCTAVPNCRKFNMFYVSDVDGSIQKMTSKNQ